MLTRRFVLFIRAVGLAVVLALPGAAADQEGTTAEDLVKRYDEIMSPVTFDGLLTMVTHRQDGTTRKYKFRVLKSHDDKVRTWFFEPASARGQEMLRVDDNMWVYMPNLKRAVRIASRESFQGGDFNNGDVLRVNYTTDYAAKLVPSNDNGLYALELKAKTSEATYDAVKLWITKAKLMPTRAEYYASSGKRLRSATFEDVKTFRGFERPSRVVMKNELATRRWSELTVLDFKVNVEAPVQKFVLDDLGR